MGRSEGLGWGGHWGWGAIRDERARLGGTGWDVKGMEGVWRRVWHTGTRGWDMEMEMEMEAACWREPRKEQVLVEGKRHPCTDMYDMVSKQAPLRTTH